MRNGRETDGYRDYDFDYENDIGEVRYRWFDELNGSKWPYYVW